MNPKAIHLSIRLVSVLLLGFIYYWIGYELERHQFWLLFSLYTVAFGLSYYLYKNGIRLRNLIGLSFIFKLIFLFAIPELSQDFYRFIWDGMLINNHFNPYLYLPKELIDNNAFSSNRFRQSLYEGMGNLNATNFSTYPPISQLAYSITYFFSGENLLYNVIGLRLFNLLAEIGLVFFSLKILKQLHLSKKNILIFILNPLVIIESVFNLHFEVVMLFFLAASLYYIYSSKIYKSAIGFAGSIASKMLTLMFIPLFFSYFNSKKEFLNRTQILNYSKFLVVTFLTLIGCYSFFYDPDILLKSSKTFSLYFTSFEFNASIYYVLRWIGFQWYGYNMIAIFGKLLSGLSLLIIIYLSFRRKRIDFKTLIKYMLFASTAYYFLATTVHPWYIIMPLFLSIFTRFRYMLIWSWLVFLSYSAYQLDSVEENHWLVAIEYLTVISVATFEITSKRRIDKNQFC